MEKAPPQHHPDRQAHHGHLRNFGDKGDSAAGPGVDLQDIDCGAPVPAPHDVKLDIHQPLHLEGPPDTQGVIHQRVHLSLREAQGGIDSDGIAAVDPCPFNMLHYPGDEYALAIGDRIHLALLPLQVFVNENGVLGVHLYGGAHISQQFLGVVDDFHGPAPQDIAWADQDRVAYSCRYLQSPLPRGDPGPRGLGDTQPAEEILKPPAVLCQVYGLSG
jgi:hypothetical protein